MKSLQFLFQRSSYRIYTLLYAAMIITVSSIPAGQLPSKPFFNDKVIHYTEYFIFGWLFFKAFVAPSPVKIGPTEEARLAKKGRDRIERRHFGTGPAWKLSGAVAFCLLFAGFDEFVQSFAPGRDSDPFDAVADAAGFSSALLFLRFLEFRKTRKSD